VGEEMDCHSSERSWGQGRWLLLLLALSAGVWWSSFCGDFIFDDYHAIIKNQNLPSLATAVSDTARPFTRLTLWLNYQISGKEIWSYHLLNILAHLVTGALLFILLVRTIDKSARLEYWRKYTLPFSFLVTLAWMIHPMQTEVVTYTIQRAETFSFFFLFWMLYALARAADASGACALLWRLSVLAAFGLGLLSKETMLVAPAVALLYDRIFWQKSLLNTLRCGILVWGVFAVGLVGVLVEWQALITLLGRGTLKAKCGPWEYFLTQCGLLQDYIALLVKPDVLCIDHLKPVVTDAANVWPQILLVCVILGLTLVALVKWPIVGFCLASFLIMSAMRSSVIPRGTMFVEHRFLLPGLSLMLLIGTLPFSLKECFPDPKLKTLRVILCTICPLLFLVGFGARTIARNFDYADPEAMWQQVLQLYPDNPRAHLMVGRMFMDEAKYPEAEPHLRKTESLGEDCWVQLGGCLLGQKKLLQAEEQFEKVIQADRGNAKAWVMLGNVRKLQGKMVEEQRCYRMALLVDAENAMANLGMADWLVNNLLADEAEPYYEKAIELDPESDPIRLRYGQWLLGQKRFNEAKEQFILAADADNLVGAKAAFQLGILAGRNQDHAKAAKWFDRARELMPDMAQYWFMAGTARVQMKQYAEAAAILQTAVKLNPDHPATHYNLGLCYEKIGQTNEARQELAIYKKLTASAGATSE